MVLNLTGLLEHTIVEIYVMTENFLDMTQKLVTEKKIEILQILFTLTTT